MPVSEQKQIPNRTAEGRGANIDFAALNRLNKWLRLFLVLFLCSVIGLPIIMENEIAGPFILVLVGAMMWSFIGYVVVIGRMAMRLNQSALSWQALTFIGNIFGIAISYPLMQWQIRKARGDPIVRNKPLRLYYFVSACWAIGVFLFVAFLDPYERGGLDRLRDNETGHMLGMMFLIPAVIGIAIVAYQRFVK